MDTTALHDAHTTFLDAADTVKRTGAVPPPAGEWDAYRVLAHVSIVESVTLEAVSAVAAGGHATYDNRLAQDEWTLSRLVERAGGGAGLLERLRGQGEALAATVATLGETELDTPVPTLLISHGALLVDQPLPLPLRDLLGGLAGSELPGHTAQLLALQSR